MVKTSTTPGAACLRALGALRDVLARRDGAAAVGTLRIYMHANKQKVRSKGGESLWAKGGVALTCGAGLLVRAETGRRGGKVAELYSLPSSSSSSLSVR